jgi:hypothetical protein
MYIYTCISYHGQCITTITQGVLIRIYIYIYIYKYIYIYLYICINIYMYIYKHLCKQHIYTCISYHGQCITTITQGVLIRIYTYIYINMYVYKNIYVYKNYVYINNICAHILALCMYICTYIYIHAYLTTDNASLQ